MLRERLEEIDEQRMIALGMFLTKLDDLLTSTSEAFIGSSHALREHEGSLRKMIEDLAGTKKQDAGDTVDEDTANAEEWKAEMELLRMREMLHKLLQLYSQLSSEYVYLGMAKRKREQILLRDELTDAKQNIVALSRTVEDQHAKMVELLLSQAIAQRATCESPSVTNPSTNALN